MLKFFFSLDKKEPFKYDLPTFLIISDPPSPYHHTFWKFKLILSTVPDRDLSWVCNDQYTVQTSPARALPPTQETKAVTGLPA